MELPAELIVGGVIISSTAQLLRTATSYTYRNRNSNINILLNCTALTNKHRCAMDRSVYLIPENHPAKKLNKNKRTFKSKPTACDIIQKEKKLEANIPSSITDTFLDQEEIKPHSDKTDRLIDSLGIALPLLLLLLLAAVDFTALVCPLALLVVVVVAFALASLLGLLLRFLLGLLQVLLAD